MSLLSSTWTSRAALVAAASILGLGTPISAAAAPAATAVDAASLVPATATFAGAVTIRGEQISYLAETGETLLRDPSGAPQATMSYTSYVAQGRDPATRPVTFAYNGGPIAATLPLREGLGPTQTAPGLHRGEFTLVANGDSLLDVTDLVFIDPPGVGYGRVLSEDAKTQVWGVEEDADAFERLIEAWLKAHGRSVSPRFLVGESYGGVRTGFLAASLARKGLPVTGLVLVSPSTSVGGGGAPKGSRDPAAMALPTEAAVARFHDRGAYSSLSIEQVAAKATDFAEHDYAAALSQGDALPLRERERIARRVSDFTGIVADQILANKLRVSNFGDTLLEGERLGRDDARLHGSLNDMKALPPPYDEPGSSMAQATYDRAYAFDSLYRFQFRYRPKGPFVALSLEANRRWNYKLSGPSGDIPGLLKDQMRDNPNLRVFLTVGYFDTTIPYLNPLSAYRSANLPPDRFEYLLVQAGHAVFSDEAARKTVSDALRKFYGDTLAAARGR